MTNILWFSEINEEQVNKAGNKAFSLAQLYKLGLPVPQGFIITAEAYKDFLQENRLDKQIFNILATADINNIKSLQLKSKEIQEIIFNSEISNDLKDEIFEAYDNLNVDPELINLHKSALSLIKVGRDLPFIALRASIILELPLKELSEQETYLNVKGNASLLNTLKKCWASLFTTRAIYFHEKNNIPHDKVAISVIIQRMINSDKSGFLFTLDPITNENEIIIQAAHGYSELITTSNVKPNNYILDKETLIIKDKRVNKQDYFLTRNEYGSNIKVNIPEEKRELQVLNDEEIIKLANYSKKIEQNYNHALEIEFAIESGKIYILQAKLLNKENI
ncbi:MAG: PEP/pyruvate-binding domain-containing protein [Nanoarchaeota archaeon]